MGPSEAIWGHLGPSGAIWGDVEPSWELWGHLMPYGAIWGHLGLSGAMLGHLEPSGGSGAVWGHLGQSGAMWATTLFSAAFWHCKNHFGETIVDNGPLATSPLSSIAFGKVSISLGGHFWEPIVENRPLATSPLFNSFWKGWGANCREQAISNQSLLSGFLAL